MTARFLNREDEQKRLRRAMNAPGGALAVIYEWGPARRWWGTGNDSRPMEVDVVAESLDGRAVLVGKAKWNEAVVDLGAGRDRLLSMARNSAWARGRDVVPVQWVKRGRRNPKVHSQTPDAVLECLT